MNAVKSVPAVLLEYDKDVRIYLKKGYSILKHS